ncbi:MFS transporter [Arthrobacter sp. ISL-65]|uniref:MFS transporter n=1 Tax=Arthrobacter sp. ISL-65 TaxID=2819112 RepID=UPI001BE82023|nr:MFS transporter [Arthrobacter sp. ISL-65]MBT2550559.1 MFS transporter [Arthrobacter sp. ISL-65]
MTSTSTGPVSESPLDQDSPTAALTAEKVRIRGPLRKLLLWFIPSTLGIYLLWGAIPGILLPLQVQGIDPANKVANLAIVTTVGALAAMLAQPIFGTISDRTRSRFGRRAPFIVGGALLGGLSLVALGLSNSILLIAVCWTLVQASFNAVQGPFSAIMPDRVPAPVRGSFAAIIGAMTMVGALGGSALAATLAANIPSGYMSLAGIAVISLTLFVLFNRDEDNRSEPRPPFKVRDFLSTFWVNPVAHPDFFWAFTGRLLLYTGYFAVAGYQLYILQDYIGLGDHAIAVVPMVSAIGLPAIIVSIAVAGPLSDKIGRRKPFVVVSSVLVGTAMMVPLVWPTFEGMLLYSVISGLGFGAFQAVDTALVSQVLPSKDAYAKDLGVVNIAATLPQTVAPAVAGAIVLAFGFAGLFPVGIILSILGALAVLPIRSVR